MAASASAKSDIEVHFLSLSLDRRAGLAKRTSHVLSIDLICPRPTVARKSSSRTVRLENGVFAPAEQGWTQSIAMKESVAGRFGFEVTVTEALTDEMADFIVRAGASALIKLFTSQFGAAFAGVNLDDIAEILPSTISKAVAKERQPSLIARGTIDFPSGARFQELTPVEVPLFATDNILKTVEHGTKGGTSQSRKVVVAKGERIGTCRIAIETV